MQKQLSTGSVGNYRTPPERPPPLLRHSTALLQEYEHNARKRGVEFRYGERLEEQLLLAQCIRDNGFEQYPDPAIGTDGRLERLRGQEFNDLGIDLSTIGVGMNINRAMLTELAESGRGLEAGPERATALVGNGQYGHHAAGTNLWSVTSILPGAVQSAGALPHQSLLGSKSALR